MHGYVWHGCACGLLLHGLLLHRRTKSSWTRTLLLIKQTIIASRQDLYRSLARPIYRYKKPVRQQPGARVIQSQRDLTILCSTFTFQSTHSQAGRRSRRIQSSSRWKLFAGVSDPGSRCEKTGHCFNTLRSQQTKSRESHKTTFGKSAGFWFFWRHNCPAWLTRCSR